MKKFILCAVILFAAPAFADDGCDCESEEEQSPFYVPGERAWPYDAELETPTNWPGKREDPFYDWLTR